MEKAPITIADLILLQEICLERELRLEQRAAEAETKGDVDQAQRERALKERFKDLKNRVLQSLSVEQTSVAPQLAASLAELTRSKYSYANTKIATPSTCEACQIPEGSAR